MIRLLLMLIVGCSQTASPAYDREQLSRKLDETPIIVRATIVEEDVDPPQGPRPWSGFASVYQGARYRVEEVLKGEVIEHEIEVKHLLVPRSLTAEKEEVSLSHEIFRKGNSVLLLLELKSDGPCPEGGGQPPCIRHYYATSSDFGAIPATWENLELVRGLIRERGTQ
jgi:hypothetical protein